tara:strand:+ start:473 stop:994 length:522 start_codon:yes stop_codon:yes gene_type:complete
MDKILIVIAVFFSSQSFASHPLPVLTVASEEWQEYTNIDGTGTYWDIIREVYGEHYQLEFISTSWSRAINLVETGRADVLVGTYKDTSRQLIFPQHHLDIEYPLYAIFDENIQSINKADDLAGLIVAGKKIMLWSGFYQVLVVFMVSSTSIILQDLLIKSVLMSPLLILLIYL